MATGVIQRPNTFYTLSRPNLLDNWYFINPINQRGKTDYPYSGSDRYNIDRWFNTGSGTVVSYWSVSQLLRIDSTNGIGYFQQILSEPLPPGTYTLSLLCSYNNGEGIGIQLRLSDGETESYSSLGSYFTGTGILSKTVTVDKNVIGVIMTIKAGGVVSLKAAKLEYGSEQTLGRYENGAWVLNDPPPDRMDERRKCRRYYLTYGGTGVISAGAGLAASATSINFVLPVEMADTPSVIECTDLYAAKSSASANRILISSISNIYRIAGALWLIGTSDGLSFGEAYMIRTQSGSLILSCEPRREYTPSS